MSSSGDFNELFEKLVADRKVDVAVVGTIAESLRTSLVRRWTAHKHLYQNLGFLTDEMKQLSLSATPTERGTCFELKRKTRAKLYVILDSDGESNGTDVQ